MKRCWHHSLVLQLTTKLVLLNVLASAICLSLMLPFNLGTYEAKKTESGGISVAAHQACKVERQGLNKNRTWFSDK